MDTPFDFGEAVAKEIVYIRPVCTDSLPDPIRAQAGDLRVLYSVHRPDGARLALVADRNLAFALARQHDLAPVNAH
jgi:hypothetical protein